ncbi:conserved protein of unknown function [Rhodovastum atsumiense]|uniref:Pyridoxamine 5'-phosphate oxidase family protein n=1 Tax=Rhodovastum atsumiense TaxID=504468 RepID=A0A5M6IYV6_9PROT|nr:hypothetical protein [Rhodovastum atsumiense]KAA5613526.1 hypothetical protein F1189_05570 [Rhodovastum atsumiense]CAH2603276.1 conserved protein of unknown function [Rhodovastum atsumiense]
MTTPLPTDLHALIADPATVKVLVTTDAEATPHAAVTDFLALADDGSILCFEPLESSRSNRNLVRAIWFDRKVAIALAAPDGRRFELTGRPLRSLIAGPVFQCHYEAFTAAHPGADLAAVWVIAIDSVTDLDFDRARRQEEATHFFFRHLDRIAIQ